MISFERSDEPPKRGIVIGGNAGGGFQKDGSLTIAKHATRTNSDGSVDKGYLISKKWLADRDAFNYCPTMGWAKEFWFEWESDK